MKNKIIATILATTIVCGTMPVQSMTRNEETITLESLIGESRNKQLPDGKYTISTKAKNESKPEEDSAANEYLNNISNLYVEDGEMTLELKFKEANLIKEISVKVNGKEPDECDIQRDDSENITLKFNIDSLDDDIILPMKINPLGFFTVSASAIIEIDKNNLRDENGNLVDLDLLPGDDESNDSDIETGDGSENTGGDGESEDSGNTGSDNDGSEESQPNKNLSEILEEGVVYTVENKVLNESMPMQIVDPTSNLQVENGTTYVTVKFSLGSMMKDIKVLVNNIETLCEIFNDSTKTNSDNLYVKFPIKSLNDDIKISVHVTAINKTVTLGLALDDSTVKDPDGNIVDVGSGSEDKIEDAPEVDLTVNKKYKANNIVTGSNGDKTPIIANYIEEHSIVEVTDKNLYVYITFVNSNIMTYRELTVNGNKQNFNSKVNSNGSYTIRVQLNSINDEMEFTNLLTRSINDGFKIRVNGNTLQEYKEENSSTSSGDNDDNDDDDLDDGTYTIKNRVLKEDSDSESMARDYLDTESGIEVKKGKIYLTLKFTKGSLMSDVSLKVNNKSTSYDVVKNSGDKYHIKFKIGSLSDETLVSATIMNSMNVKFRVLLRSSTLDKVDDDADDDVVEEETEENDNELSGGNNADSNTGIENTVPNGSENSNGGGSGNGNNSNLGSYTRTTYSINNEVVCESQIGYQAARDAINELSYLEYENDKIYLTLNLQNTDLMSNIRVAISGNEVNYNTFNKNSSNNTMSIKFEVPNDNPSITIKAYIGMIGRDISFGLNLLGNTKTFIKSEEINASQLESISGSSQSSSSTGTASGNSSESSSNGSGSSSDIASVTEQLSNSAIEAKEYFKRYTINNEVISDSAMGRTMARKYLNEISILEEIDGQFYITVTFSGTSAMDNFRFTVNGTDVEYNIVLDDSENGIKSFRFPISSVNDSIQAYIFIKPVKMNIDFGIKLLEDTMTLIEEGTVEDGTLNQEGSLLNDIIDKTTKNSSTGEISPMKIAVSTSALTIVLNQLVGLIAAFIKKKSKKKLVGSIIED